MDTKTLVVGQDVHMVSGVYGCEGTVIEVTPSGAVVRTDQHSYPLDGRAQGKSKDDPIDWNAWWDTWHDRNQWHNNAGLSGLLRFDNNGEGCDGLGTFECGPWHIENC